MKKILAIVLALALVLALGAVSFADFEPDYEKTITYLQGGHALSAESFPQAGEKVTVRVTGNPTVNQ